MTVEQRISGIYHVIGVGGGDSPLTWGAETSYVPLPVMINFVLESGKFNGERSCCGTIRMGAEPTSSC